MMPAPPAQAVKVKPADASFKDGAAVYAAPSVPPPRRPPGCYALATSWASFGKRLLRRLSQRMLLQALRGPSGRECLHLNLSSRQASGDLCGTRCARPGLVGQQAAGACASPLQIGAGEFLLELEAG